MNVHATCRMDGFGITQQLTLRRVGTTGTATQVVISFEPLHQGRQLLKVSQQGGGALFDAEVPSAAVWQARPCIFFVQASSLDMSCRWM